MSFLERWIAKAFDAVRTCATICDRCLLDDDDVKPGTFGDYSLCGRCRRSVTSKDAAFALFRRSAECPVCRTPHLDDCDRKAIAALLAARGHRDGDSRDGAK